MAEIADPNLLRRGISYSHLLILLNGIVIGVVVWNLIFLLQGFFAVQGNYQLVVQAFQGRVWLAYGLTWLGVLLTGIDLLITIFRHEFFHAGNLTFKNLRNPTDANLRILIYHGFAAGINTTVLIGWIAYFAHGITLFHGEITFGSITVSPAEYLAYLLINWVFAIAILILALFMLYTRRLTAKRFLQELQPRPIQSATEVPKPGSNTLVTIIDEKRVPMGELPSGAAVYVPIEERKAQKLEDLRIRRERAFEDEKEKMTRELEEKKQELLGKKQELLDRQRKEHDEKLRNSKQYKKIKLEIELKKSLKPQPQKPAEKEIEKRRDEYDFT